MRIRDYNGKTRPPRIIEAPIARNGSRVLDSIFIGFSRTVSVAGVDDGVPKKDANWVEGDWFFGTASSEYYSLPSEWTHGEGMELIYRKYDAAGQNYKLEWQHEKFDNLDNQSEMSRVREILLKRKVATVIPVVSPIVYGICHRCFTGSIQWVINMGRCTICGGMLQRL